MSAILKYNVQESEKTPYLQKDAALAADNVMSSVKAMADVTFAIVSGLEWSGSQYGEGMVIMDGVLRSVASGATRSSYLEPLDYQTESRTTKGGATANVYTEYTTTITTTDTGYPQLTEANVAKYRGWITSDFLQVDAVTEKKIANGSVSNDKLATVPSMTVKGNITAAEGTVEDISTTELVDVLNLLKWPDFDDTSEVLIEGMTFDGDVYGKRYNGNESVSISSGSTRSTTLESSGVTTVIGAVGYVGVTVGSVTYRAPVGQYSSGAVASGVYTNSSNSSLLLAITNLASGNTSAVEYEVYVLYKSGTQEYLSISPTSFSLSYEGGTETLSITASDGLAWSLSTGVDWITADKTSGTGSDTVTLTVLESESTEVRTATITVSGGSITRTASVSQEAAPEPGKPTIRITLDSNEQSRLITVTLSQAALDDLEIEGGSTYQGVTGPRWSISIATGQTSGSVTTTSSFDLVAIDSVNEEQISPLETDNAIYTW